MMPELNEIVVYQFKELKTRLDVRVEDESTTFREFRTVQLEVIKKLAMNGNCKVMNAHMKVNRNRTELPYGL
jgi:hypothetical protein